MIEASKKVIGSKSCASGWAVMPLSQVAEITMGNSPPGDTYNEVGDGIPLINGPVEFSRGAFGYTLKKKFTSKPTKLCKAGDFLICVRGSTTGRTNIAAFDACIGRGVAAIRAKGHQQYLNHYISTLEKVIHASGIGSTFPSISQNQLFELPVPIPLDVQEQKRIAEILDRAEALRSQRRAALALLDELTQSIFLDMFGDPACNAKEWELVPIRRILDSATYGTISKAGSEGEFPVLRMNNISRSGGLDLSDLKYIDIPEAKRARYLVYKGDVLFNRTNSVDLVGKTCAYLLEKPMAYAGYLIRLRPNEHNTAEFLSAFLNTRYAKKVLRNMCKSIIGMANINAQEIQEMLIFSVPKKKQMEFVRRVDAVRKQRRVLNDAAASFGTLFSALQHRAFRGELW